MLVDPATLRDLEILDAPDGAKPLAALLDHTGTTMGRDRLRSRLREPLRTVGEIRATQEGVRHLLSRLDAVRAALAGLPTDETERYLGLRWEPARASSRFVRSLEAAWLKGRYFDAMRDMSRGAKVAKTFIDGLVPLLNVLGDDAPPVLRRLIDPLRGAGDDAALAEVRQMRNASSSMDALRVDQLVRGDGRIAMRVLLATVAEIDALQSLAFAGRQHGWTLPEVVDGAEPELTLLELRHPFLPDGVPNDVQWRPGVRVAAITGPNMAGKTTLLKATALAVHLAHCGAAVPARTARLSIADAGFASLYVRDSLAAGESFYLSEVRRVRQLARLLSEHRRVFAVIDEPFKGTNIRDASDASDLLLAALSEHPGCRVLVATHLTDVVRRLAGAAGLDALRLEGSVTESGPRFDFQLHDGVSEQRLGMELLRREGVIQLLEERFRALAGRS